jgi:hypothetical protein
VIAALAFSGCLHVYVLERLFNLNPEPTALSKPAAAWRDTEFTYEFLPPAPPPDPVLAKESPVAAPAVPRPARPPAATAKTTQPQAATDLPAANIEWAAPAVQAADLLRQIPHTARQGVPAAAQRRGLDLTVPRMSDNGIIKPERRTAGVGGAPTRGAMAPVGDLANGLLIERWQEMHHGNHSLGCKSRPQGEPLSSYLGRCKQGL